MDSRPGDVGGWFRTASDGALQLPKVAPWGPIAGEEFGRVSAVEDIATALDMFRGRSTMVLTGAGMSTGSGLPDYRGRDTVPRSPMTYQEFVASDLSRRRYWARSTVGWRSFVKAGPGAAHLALARLGKLTPLTGIVTQNVDGLHRLAGSHPVVALHGDLDDVVCLGCGAMSRRDELQIDLLRLNPDYAVILDELAADVQSAPDGDAEVDRTENFNYPACNICGGILKPAVVFFGENAKREVVSAAEALLSAADLLLVLGTSLTVMSGLRFVKRAVKDGRDVIIVNDGPTRGDSLATLRLHGRLEPVLSSWVQSLT